MFDFAEAVKEMSAAEILNYYRNLYYAEPQVTERGIVANAINDYLAADVQEVKHAKWVHYGENIQCSNCGHVSDDVYYEGDMDSGYYTVLPNYCSNCGAKMDLED